MKANNIISSSSNVCVEDPAALNTIKSLDSRSILIYWHSGMTALFKLTWSLCLLLCIPLWPLSASATEILVTLKPIHSLVSALTLNISEPQLLLNNSQSPHHYSMKPSDRRRFNQADIIIYTSADIESFMPAIQKNLAHQKVIPLTNIPGIQLLRARTFNEDTNKNTSEHFVDGHIWLSIDNAMTISQYLTDEFIKQDVENAEKYSANKKHLMKKLAQLKINIQQQMQAFSDRPFLMFHDAFQYFEHDFNLTGGLFVSTSPEHKAGLRHIRHLKNKIQHQRIHCVFYEPPHIPKIIQTITKGQHIQPIPLEPLGIKYSADHNQYFKLLNGISNKLHHCLKRNL